MISSPRGFKTVAAAVYEQPRTATPCKPTFWVIFTPVPQQLMDNVATKQPQLLGFHFVSEVPKLKTCRSSHSGVVRDRV